ncbi:hypothetical protein SAMN05216388_10505 [Halorientalis persicus]|uniref:Uncharacterized protein n=1 Tax=Halorientalis persicus TaxID=1367881 RepID=A0A1H8W6L2_9EURY|nr:hypothetical protein [Halorientalis persicus]SEP23282.1 hypothetical protein SAMN05216388_10505 [Halorientalis persicus]
MTRRFRRDPSTRPIVEGENRHLYDGTVEDLAQTVNWFDDESIDDGEIRVKSND